MQHDTSKPNNNPKLKNNSNSDDNSQLDESLQCISQVIDKLNILTKSILTKNTPLPNTPTDDSTDLSSDAKHTWNEENNKPNINDSVNINDAHKIEERHQVVDSEYVANDTIKIGRQPQIVDSEYTTNDTTKIEEIPQIVDSEYTTNDTTKIEEIPQIPQIVDSEYITNDTIKIGRQPQIVDSEYITNDTTKIGRQPQIVGSGYNDDNPSDYMNNLSTIVSQLSVLSKAVLTNQNLNNNETANKQITSATQDNSIDLCPGNAYTWSKKSGFCPQSDISILDIDLILIETGIKEKLRENTIMFCNGFSANNALLWGASGTGKSSLLKSIWSDSIRSMLTTETDNDDVNNNENNSNINILPILISVTNDQLENFISMMKLKQNKEYTKDYKIILFVDDLDLSNNLNSVCDLKSSLIGNICEQPKNLLIYATSSYPKYIKSSSTNINYTLHGESNENSFALSKRFGLSINFKPFLEKEFLDVVLLYLQRLSIDPDRDDRQTEMIIKQAKRWSRTHSNDTSGMVALQFIKDLAGTNQMNIDEIYHNHYDMLNSYLTNEQKL